MILGILFVLIILADILALRDIMSRNIASSMKLFWAIVVLAIPIIGLSIYYFVKR